MRTATARGDDHVIRRQAVYGACSTLPGADAQTECRQSGAAYFGNAAVGAIHDALGMRFERRVTESTCRSSGYRRLQIYFGFLIGTRNC